MSKTPYEVRLDVMKMAQEMLDSDLKNKQLAFREQLEQMRSSRYGDSDIINFINEKSPKPYSENEVMEKATALYSFVTSKI